MPKIFRVYPNPFIHLDHDGYPAGMCPCDMLHHVGMTTRKFVGASLDADQTIVLEKLSAEEQKYRNARQQTRFKFNFEEPTELPVTEYYRDRFRDGEIFAADAETHRMTELPGPFVPPKEALAKSKAAAVVRWKAETGSDKPPEFIDCLDQAIAALGSPKAAPEATPPPPVPSKSVKSS